MEPTEEVFEAIRGSVMKWSMIVHMGGKDQGSFNCPLCKLYLDEGIGCTKCPIVTHGGGYTCDDTLYGEWDDHLAKEHFGWEVIRLKVIQCPECRRLAQAELMFLQGVLEKYKKNMDEVPGLTFMKYRRIK